MRKLIYIAVVGFFFVIGFLNLERNEWYPAELPDLQIGEKILPKEEWKDILIGKWDYVHIYKDKFIDATTKGTVLFNLDSTFTKTFSFIGTIHKDEFDINGSLTGKWEIVEESECWMEEPDPDNVISSISDEYKYHKITLFTSFFKFCEQSSDLWKDKVIYFNHSRIEIRSEHLGEEPDRVYRLIRVD